MRARGFFGAAAVLATAFTLAGCGGSSGAGSGSSLGAGAAIAPSDSVAFAAVNTDVSSSQWKAVDSLLQKFPAHDTLLTNLQQSVEQKTGLSWANDIKPALGPELDIVVLPQDANGKAQFVGLTQPADASKLDALLKKVGSAKGEQLVTTQLSGWTAFSGSQAALDAVTGAKTHLADDNTYQDAMAKLSGGAVATLYANATEAQQALANSLPTKFQVPGGANVQWVSADVVAESGGLKVNGYARTEGGTPPAPAYASALVSQIPAGALAVADFNATATTTAAESPLASALGGETAVYVSPGEPIPAVTLVTQPADPTAAYAAIEKAFSGLSANPMLGTLAPILGSIHLVHAVVDGKLVVSTSQQAITDFQSGGKKLAGDSGFKDATSAAGMPDNTNGFVYANLDAALPLVEGFASLSGKALPAGLQDNLAQLHSLTGYVTRSGDETSFTLFVQIG
jgi:predicted small secreted protein